jgi:glycosyltransferase involved in cell wall biosynthesis
VIYHHSVYWEGGETILGRAKAQVIFKYHNITPPSFFAEFEPYWEACLLGREQTYRFVGRHKNALWLSDSFYNFAEAGISGLPQLAVVPPFLSPIVTRRVCPDSSLLKKLIESNRMHVLMVGRFVPNKGHRLFLRVLQAYRERYDDGITGIIVGKLDPVCRSYCDSVMKEARDSGMTDSVCYVESVPETELLSYYLGCDAYLCCSDHEGFCVPVVESQCAYLPVVAKRIGAVQETLGAGGILLDEDPTEYAETIHWLQRDQGYWSKVVEQGYANYADRFTTERIASTFVRALEEHLGIPV